MQLKLLKTFWINLKIGYFILVILYFFIRMYCRHRSTCIYKHYLLAYDYQVTCKLSMES